MSAFGDAFTAARKAGKKNFMFNGKSYHTKTKEEVNKEGPKARPRSGPSPKPRPKSKPMPGEAATPPRADPKPIYRAAAGTPDASGAKVMKVESKDRKKARSEVRAANRAARISSPHR